MKLVIIFLLVGTNIFPQLKIEYSAVVKDFFSSVQKYHSTYNIDQTISDKISIQETEELYEKYYFAKAKDPIGFRNYVRELAKNRKEKFIETGELEKSPGWKVHIIKKLIADKFGGEFAEMMDVPFFLHIKILDIKPGIYESEVDKMIVAPKTIILAEIIDIIKGKDFFVKGDMIEINIINQWMAGAKSFFEINKEYFAPIEPWECFEDNCLSIRLSFLPDENFGIYPIENEFIRTNGNYFGINEFTKWTEFKREFLDKFIIKQGE